MEEFELKARLTEGREVFRRRLQEAGWRRTFRGAMVDRRYDTPTRELEARDEVLRIRRYEPEEGEWGEEGAGHALLGWKGPASTEDGFKLREEVETRVEDGEAVAEILARLGYPEVTLAIDRRIEVFARDRVTVRIEEYPHMDILVEVEGAPEDIERCLEELGLPREAWVPWTLDEFIRRYEDRTGETARLTWDGERP